MKGFGLKIIQGVTTRYLVSDQYPDGPTFSFSELLMIERIHCAFETMNAKDEDAVQVMSCDFETASEILKFIGWDEEKSIATVLSQADVDDVVELWVSAEKYEG